MKRILTFISFLLLFFSFANKTEAQNKNELFRNKLLKRNNKLFHFNTVEKRANANFQFDFKYKVDSQFDVYTLKLDNMPCLVPSQSIENNFHFVTSNGNCVKIPNGFTDFTLLNNWNW